MLPSGKIIASDRQTGLYVLKTNFTLTGVSNEITNIKPDNYSLEQNYPNPFNPSTVIKYQIPSSDFVSLKVYNEAGMEIADLVNENQTPGTYEIKFDGSKLSSGIYFYNIIAGEFNTTKKMLLIK